MYAHVHKLAVFEFAVLYVIHMHVSISVPYTYYTYYYTITYLSTYYIYLYVGGRVNFFSGFLRNPRNPINQSVAKRIHESPVLHCLKVKGGLKPY